MMDAYLWIKLLHILSSAILFGTGLGTAFHMWLTHRTGEPRSIATASRTVVIADFLFTTPAVILQPATGAALIRLAGTDPLDSWLIVTYGLYVVAGACWIPVVWLQIKIHGIARDAVATGRALPPQYDDCMRLWFALGWPAFGAVIAIFWLMVEKPDLW